MVTDPRGLGFQGVGCPFVSRLGRTRSGTLGWEPERLTNSTGESRRKASLGNTDHIPNKIDASLAKKRKGKKGDEEENQEKALEGRGTDSASRKGGGGNVTGHVDTQCAHAHTHRRVGAERQGGKEWSAARQRAGCSHRRRLPEN